eukprot:SM000015S01289  [mRNA]  locus=s15:1013277:1015689:- [translate_table: standard]
MSPVAATVLVCLWAARLGTHLFSRVLQVGRDSRFDGVRAQPGTWPNPPYFFAFWTIQAVWIYMVLLPVLLLNSGGLYALWPGWTDLLGLGVWIAGFAVETIADYQKNRFRRLESSKGKWIDSGLWRYSRHPNYFGEMVLWWGVYLLSFRSLAPMGRFVALISPVGTMYLLIRVSGIPLLEKAALKKWGTDVDYQEYLRTTSKLIPWVHKQGRRAKVL